MEIKDFKKYESMGLIRLLEKSKEQAGRFGCLERMVKMRDYALESLRKEDGKACMDALDDIMPYFIGIIGELKREL